MKIREIIVLDEAVEDLVFGKRFYDAKEFGIGDYFVDSILSDLASLKIYAGIHPNYFGYMRMLSKRFPFAIYYEISDRIARVVGVLDMRMHPDTIRNTLNKRTSQ